MTSAHQSPVVGPVPAGRDPEDYDRTRRRVLWSLPTGLYVLGSVAGDRRNLMTISWVMQLATEPKLVGASVERAAVTHRLLSEGEVFALSLIPRNEPAVVRRFAKPCDEVDVDDAGVGTMQGVAVHAAGSGAPVLDVASAWIDCRVVRKVELGSHDLFVGEVIDVAESDAASAGARRPAPHDVLRMEDTRMSYGG